MARDLGARIVTVHIGFADFMMAETGPVWRSVVDYLKEEWRWQHVPHR